MIHPKDLSLLAMLDVLLTEGSVTAAADKMNLSVPAMSRILGQIRTFVGDPLLVRAGRGLVPTPKALALQEKVRSLMATASTILADDDALDFSAIDRIFTIRAHDAFIGSFGQQLAERIRLSSPKVVLRFVAERDEGVRDLRLGKLDLDIGVIQHAGPEVIVIPLLVDRFVGVVRQGHRLSKVAITRETFAGEKHISTSRRGRLHGPVDAALATSGLTRIVSVVVPGFYDALAIAKQSDFVAIVPEKMTTVAREGMFTFALPVVTDSIPVSLAWHPRLETDSAHRWLRNSVLEVCHENELSLFQET